MEFARFRGRMLPASVMADSFYDRACFSARHGAEKVETGGIGVFQSPGPPVLGLLHGLNVMTRPPELPGHLTGNPRVKPEAHGGES